MTDIRPITKSGFADLKWQRVSNYGFAKQDSLCPISFHELPQAIKSMATGFIKRDNEFALVAVLGLKPNSNLYVGKDDQWINRYLPMAYRTYPFLLLPNKDSLEELVFCVDFESGLISDQPSGEELFSSDGELTPYMKQLFDFLRDIRLRMDATTKLCSFIDSFDLIQPWKIATGSGEKQVKVEGLYSIDEAALNELPDDKFLELRQAGALPMIYCQLLSMRNLDGLKLFSQELEKGIADSSKELDFSLRGDDGNLQFNV